MGLARNVLGVVVSCVWLVAAYKEQDWERGACVRVVGRIFRPGGTRVQMLRALDRLAVLARVYAELCRDPVLPGV